MQNQFDELEQGTIIVTNYEIRVYALARHTLMSLPTKKEHIRKFVQGFYPCLFVY